MNRFLPNFDDSLLAVKLYNLSCFLDKKIAFHGIIVMMT